MVFSPASIHVVLSLLAAGCTSGPTREQLLSFLRSKSCDHLNLLSSEIINFIFVNRGISNGAPKLSSVNGIWVDKTLPLRSAFKEVVDRIYKATSDDQVDFINNADEVIAKVNSWTKDETKNLIEEVLPQGSVDERTRLIFTNAIYFKAFWNQNYFDASQTKEEDFHLLNGTRVKVPFMTTKKDQFIRAFDGFKVLRLPYKQGEETRSFSMYFYLPDAKDGLPALVERICSESNFLNQYQPYREVEVGGFKLPRFKMTFEFEASKIMKELGVELPFLEGGVANMVETTSPIARKLYVSSVHHKSFIEVNEEGTEAAAATAMVCSLQCAMLPTDFVADHPFMFMIREDTTGVMLFAGHVMNPSES